MSPNIIRRHPLNSWTPVNTLTTFLPVGSGLGSDNILIMVSVSDSFGAITNVTNTISVSRGSSIVSGDVDG